MVVVKIIKIRGNKEHRYYANWVRNELQAAEGRHETNTTNYFLIKFFQPLLEILNVQIW